MNRRSVLSFTFLTLSIAISNTSLAVDPLEIRLWEGTAPGSEGAGAVRETVEERGTPEKHDRKVQGVTVPTIKVHLPPKKTNTGAAFVLIPGGGYSGLAIDKEGHDIARYLNTIGITGIVLKYRLPRPEGFVFHHDVPLSDAVRAIRITRHYAKEWGLDPDRIGVMGASAGGHLASSLATHFDEFGGESTDSIDSLSSRPDFQVLLYPVISFRDGIAHGGSRRNLIGENPSPDLIDRYSNELQVTVTTPPAFLVSTYDDHVKAENSMLYFKALRAVDVPAELHIYEVGGHGYGISPTGNPVSTWHLRMAEWMKQRELLEKD